MCWLSMFSWHDNPKLLHLQDDVYSEQYISTIGVDFVSTENGKFTLQLKEQIIQILCSMYMTFKCNCGNVVNM